jgi:ParB-like chromosome segregation protein Spo0J
MAKKQADPEGGKGASYAVEMVAMEHLSEDPANARKHGEKNVDAIVASLRRFGQQKPIVIDQNNVVRAGNGTLQAARVLGWQEIAAYRSTLAGAEMAAYAIADNRTAELAEWDEEILRATLEGLAVDDTELLEAAGYSEDELGEIVSEAIEEVKIKQIKELEPPSVSWVLLGIPTVRFGEISADIERLATIPDIICETTANGG